VSLDARVSYRLLASADERRQAETLMRGSSVSLDQAPLDAECVVLGAFEDDRLIGATASRLMPDDAQPARVERDLLHVFGLAVLEQAAGRGIATGLMRVQRLLAIREGLRLVTWEQDPLEGTLAHLAIRKLGAVSRSLRGASGAGADRALEVEWWVSSPRVQTRLAGQRPDLDLAHALEAGAPKLNAGRLGDDGLLHPTGGELGPEGAMALVEVPHALHELRVRGPGLVEAWRAHVDSILSEAFSRGYWMTDYLWLRGERVPRAYFLLIDGERTLG
jgi:predicted GNAT superfamily acetyltransferase